MNIDHRNMKGQLGPVYLLCILLAICILGAVAVDISHMACAKAELQNATDAGALAGAAHLWFDVDNAEPDAYKFTGLNTADGRAVANGSRGTQVVVTVLRPTPTTSGTVTVDATMEVSHFLARLFDRFDDRIHVTSVAGTSGKLWRLAANQAFPLTVSLDAIPRAKGFVGEALNTKSLGDDFTIFIGSQGPKNAAFTSLSKKPASAAFIKDAIGQCLKLDPPIDGFIPSLSVNDQISLDNGISGQLALAKEPLKSALSNQACLILPVIEGDAPYVQSRPVRAFIGLKVKTVKLHQGAGIVESIEGTLVPVQALGETAPENTTGTWPTGPIARISLSPVQLIR